MTHPKKWYIPVTEENHAELNRWRLSKRTSKASKWDYLFIPGTLLVSEHPYDGTYFFSNFGNFLKCHYQEITLEKFRQITNSQPMKHPEKWYIPVTEENHAELLPWWQTKTEGSEWPDLREGRILLSEHPEDSSYYWGASEGSLTAWYPSYQKITLEQFRQITNTKPMTHPEHWCIEATKENFSELKAWWEENADTDYDFKVGYTLMSQHPKDRSKYYGGDIKNCIDDYPQFVEITLEQFRQITNSQPMKHPEKWYIPVTKENHEELNRWRLSKRTLEASIYDIQFRPGAFLLSEHAFDGSYFYTEKVYCRGYQEITLEQFRQITNQIQTTMAKQIEISRELLNEYYNAATTPQKIYLTKHFKLDGTTTVEAIRGLHDMACGGWKPRIKKNHPDCFPEDSKQFDFSEHVNRNKSKRVVPADVCQSLGLVSDFIQVRESDNSELHNRSFYLSNSYNWELKFDGGAVVLIPTKKSCN